MSEEEIQNYRAYPIKEDCFYYCKFYNGYWHMGASLAEIWHRFEMHSRVGQVEHGISANHFMGEANEPTGYTLRTQCMVKDDGTEFTLQDRGGATLLRIFTDASNSVFIKINDSRLKHMYLKNSETHPEIWFTEIESIGGYFGDQNLPDIAVHDRKCEEATHKAKNLSTASNRSTFGNHGETVGTMSGIYDTQIDEAISVAALECAQRDAAFKRVWSGSTPEVIRRKPCAHHLRRQWPWLNLQLNPKRQAHLGLRQCLR